MSGERPHIAHPISRFLSRVEVRGAHECWPWKGAGKANGYGHLTVGGKQIGAHRQAYQYFIGEVPDGLDVCHTCDNRWCVNPDHLFAGTREENMSDCKKKGRAVGGNRKHLKERDVQEIKRRLNAGHSRRKIANQMDVSYETVAAISRGESYVRFDQ